MIKPSIFFVLILCITGYNFLHNIHKTRFKLIRSDGYHTFLMSATAGLFLFCVTLIPFFFGGLLSKIGMDFSFGQWVLTTAFQDAPISKWEGTLADMAFCMILLSIYLPRAIYQQAERLIGIQRAALYREEFENDPESPEYTQLFFKSMRYGLPILFTMSDRKVYIGYLIEMYAAEFNDIHIIPIFSGYRNQDDLKLIQVTPYRDVLRDLKEKGGEEVDFEKFAVTLPIREIKYAHLHDFEYEDDFLRREAELKQRRENSDKTKPVVKDPVEETL